MILILIHSKRKIINALLLVLIVSSLGSFHSKNELELIHPKQDLSVGVLDVTALINTSIYPNKVDKKILTPNDQLPFDKVAHSIVSKLKSKYFNNLYNSNYYSFQKHKAFISTHFATST